jgi:hypothetical protein
MPEHIRYEDDDLFNPETHHEHSDVPVRPLWWAMIIFVIFAILSHIVVWYLYKAFVAAENRRAEAPQTAIARPADYGVPRNQPLLQPFPRVDPTGAQIAPYLDTPVSDLDEMRRHEEAQLQSYGWVNQQQGSVRIPIDRAKEIFVTRVALSAAGVQTGSSELIPPAGGTLPVEADPTMPEPTPRLPEGAAPASPETVPPPPGGAQQ